MLNKEFPEAVRKEVLLAIHNEFKSKFVRGLREK